MSKLAHKNPLLGSLRTVGCQPASTHDVDDVQEGSCAQVAGEHDSGLTVTDISKVIWVFGSPWSSWGRYAGSDDSQLDNRQSPPPPPLLPWPPPPPPKALSPTTRETPIQGRHPGEKRLRSRARSRSRSGNPPRRSWSRSCRCPLEGGGGNGGSSRLRLTMSPLPQPRPSPARSYIPPLLLPPLPCLSPPS